jgi:hypothetical protein
LNYSRYFLKVVLTGAALSFGAWQLFQGLKSIFVFTNAEAIDPALWVIVVGGYFFTLPTGLLSIMKPKVAGWLLMIVSAASALVAVANFSFMLVFSQLISNWIPNFVIAYPFLVDARGDLQWGRRNR